MTIKAGFREPRSWDQPGKSTTLDAISKLCQSDDGWVCPRCGARGTVKDSEMSSQDWTTLMNMDEAIEQFCQECDQPFWLRANVVTTYQTSTTTSFDEDDHCEVCDGTGTDPNSNDGENCPKCNVRHP